MISNFSGTGQQTEKMGQDPPLEEQHGSTPQESIKFEVLKLSCVPEIKKKKSWTHEGWVKDSDRNWGQSDWLLFCSGSLKSGGAQTLSSWDRKQGATTFILPFSTESLQGAKQHHLLEAKATYTKHCFPVPWRHNFHLGKSTWESAQ